MQNSEQSAGTNAEQITTDDGHNAAKPHVVSSANDDYLDDDDDYDYDDYDDWEERKMEELAERTDARLTSANLAQNPVLAAVSFRENDVFNFRYKPDEAKKRFEPYHCFDGTVVVKKYSNSLYLVDTYWSSGDSITFTPDEAIEKGELTFLCNLDEMVDIKDFEALYYDDVDIVKMHIHAGYRSRFLIKKGTQRSQAKMLQSIKQKIEDEHSKIKSAENSLKWHNETLKKVEAGDTSVYL